MSHWIEKFNLFLGRYTYRQRFIFFSFIFFIVTPFPAYWKFKMLNAKITHWNIIGTGLEIQQAFSNVYWPMLEGELTLGVQGRSASEEFIKKKWKLTLEESIEKIEELQVFSPHTMPSLGAGFSGFTAPNPPTEAVGAIWLEFVRLSAQNPQNATAYIKLNKSFCSQITLMAEGYGFALLTTPKQLLISNLAFKSLPEIGYQLMNLWWMERLGRSDMEFQRALNSLEVQIDQIRNALRQMRWMHWEDSTLTSLEELLVDHSHLLRLEVDNLHESLLNNTEALLMTLKEGRRLQNDLMNVLEKHRLAQLAYLHSFKLFLMIILCIASFMICMYLIFRVLTRHILHIFSHIRQLADGHFVSFEYWFGPKDEFYAIGNAFNHVADSLHVIVKKLNELGLVAAKSTHEIILSIVAQRSIVKHQETQVLQSQIIADKIKRNFDSLQITRSGLGLSIESQHFTIIQEELSELEASMSDLAEDSSKILNCLQMTKLQVSEAAALTLAMQKTCDHAHLLGLNASIETVYTEPFSHAFQKTTKEIQHFADHALLSTQYIQKVIDEIETSMSDASHEVTQSLGDIQNGLFRLQQLDRQLSGIAQHTEQQTAQLVAIDTLVNMQSIEAEEALSLIRILNLGAQESSAYLDGLYHSIQIVNGRTEALQRIIHRFPMDTSVGEALYDT